jgi:hypothetical protein
MRIIDQLRMASEGPITVWGWVGIALLLTLEAAGVLEAAYYVAAISWGIIILPSWALLQHISGLIAW